MYIYVQDFLYSRFTTKKEKKDSADSQALFIRENNYTLRETRTKNVYYHIQTYFKRHICICILQICTEELKYTI